MRDFIMAALPFVAAGAAIAVAVVYLSHREKGRQNADYALEGMCLGMCFGVLFGSLCDPAYIGLGLSAGMLLGLLIGMCAPKRENGQEKGKGGGDIEAPK